MRDVNNRQFAIFAVAPLVPVLVVIAFVMAIYFFIASHHLFEEWIFYIDTLVKVIIGFQILRGAMRSLLVPVIACLIGLVMMVAVTKYGFSAFMVSTINAWELIIVSFIGILISMIRVIRL